MEYKPQITCFHTALSCAATSIFLQLHLYPAVHISFSKSLGFQVFLGRPLWPCGVHCSASLAMMSSFLLSVYPSHSIFTVQRYALHGLSYRNSVRPSVHPSVRPSITIVDCVHIVRPTIMISSQHGSPIILVSGDITFIPKFEGGHPERGH